MIQSVLENDLIFLFKASLWLTSSVSTSLRDLFFKQSSIQKSATPWFLKVTDKTWMVKYCEDHSSPTAGQLEGLSGGLRLIRRMVDKSNRATTRDPPIEPLVDLFLFYGSFRDISQLLVTSQFPAVASNNKKMSLKDPRYWILILFLQRKWPLGERGVRVYMIDRVTRLTGVGRETRVMGVTKKKKLVKVNVDGRTSMQVHWM